MGSCCDGLSNCLITDCRIKLSDYKLSDYMIESQLVENTGSFNPITFEKRVIF